MQNRVHAMNVKEGVDKKGTIIGSITADGKISFSEKPKFHLNESSVTDEMVRLATQFPGTTFVAFKVTKSVVASGLLWK